MPLRRLRCRERSDTRCLRPSRGQGWQGFYPSLLDLDCWASLKTCRRGMKLRPSARGSTGGLGATQSDIRSYIFCVEHYKFPAPFHGKCVRWRALSNVATQHVKQHARAHVHIHAVSQKLVPVLRRHCSAGVHGAGGQTHETRLFGRSEPSQR